MACFWISEVTGFEILIKDMHMTPLNLKKRMGTKKEPMCQVCIFFFSCENHLVVLLLCMQCLDQEIKPVFLHVEKGKSCFLNCKLTV